MSIHFSCHATLPGTAQEICAQIFDLAQWPNFTGHGPIPGIASAQFEKQTDNWVGTRIQVENKDGSRHLEEVTRWDGAKELQLKMAEFKSPLRFLASHFEENWFFDAQNLEKNTTQVRREFQLYPQGLLGRCLLPLIAYFLKQAVEKHLQQLSEPRP